MPITGNGSIIPFICTLAIHCSVCSHSLEKKYIYLNIYLKIFLRVGEYDLCLQRGVSLQLHFLTSNCLSLTEAEGFKLPPHFDFTYLICFLSDKVIIKWKSFVLASKLSTFWSSFKNKNVIIICRFVSNIKCHGKPCYCTSLTVGCILENCYVVMWSPLTLLKVLQISWNRIRLIDQANQIVI